MVGLGPAAEHAGERDARRAEVPRADARALVELDHDHLALGRQRARRAVEVEVGDRRPTVPGAASARSSAAMRCDSVAARMWAM